MFDLLIRVSFATIVVRTMLVPLLGLEAPNRAKASGAIADLKRQRCEQLDILTKIDTLCLSFET